MLSMVPALGLALAGCPIHYDDMWSDDDSGDDGVADDDAGDDDSGDDDAGDDDTGDDDTGDDDTGDDDAGDDDAGETHALVSITDFYAFGALSTVDLDTHAVAANVAGATLDTWVAAGTGMALALDAFGYDQVTAYEHPDYATPLWTTQLAAGANPRSAAVLPGKVFVAQYGAPALAVLNGPDGVPVGSIDLTPYADADGNPECAHVAVLDGDLYVSCHRLDASWQPAPEGGLLLRVDPLTEQVTGSWTAYGGLTCRAFPGRTDLICHEGVDLDASWLDVYEGAIFTFDPVAEAFGPDLFLEQTLAANTPIHGFGPGDFGLIATAGATGTGLVCADLSTGAVSNPIALDLGWIVDIAVNDRGEAYVLNRSSWSSPYAGPFGVSVYDLNGACTDVGGGILDVGGEPYHVAFTF